MTNTWGETLSGNVRKLLIGTVADRAGELIDNEKNTAIEDVLLFFAVPEVMRKILQYDPRFARQYSTLVTDKISASLGNLIRRRFVGNSKSLCEEEQFDIFSCLVDNNVTSVCLADTPGGEQIEYRYGKPGALSLRLVKRRGKLKETDGEISFLNGDYRYIVSNRIGSLDASIIVRRNSALVTKNSACCKTWNRYISLFGDRKHDKGRQIRLRFTSFSNIGITRWKVMRNDP
jgi:hypothetical protein